MQRILALIVLVVSAFVIAFYPQPAAAAPFEWVPRVLRYLSPYRGNDVSRYPGYVCMARNMLGNCVVYSYREKTISRDTSKFYRRTTSPRNSKLNYSNCVYDDYKRKTSRHTRYSECDSINRAY